MLVITLRGLDIIYNTYCKIGFIKTATHGVRGYVEDHGMYSMVLLIYNFKKVGITAGSCAKIMYFEEVDKINIPILCQDLTIHFLIHIRSS